MPRVGNKKSRRGCLRCKNRKVKCDEVRPTCGWCSDHELVCEYPNAPQPRNVVQLPPTPVSEEGCQNDNRIERPDRLTELTDRRTLELGLFQYYILHVAPEFPYVDQVRGSMLHAHMIPQVALRCPCLLNTLFAYALLHMHIQMKVHDTPPQNADFFEEQGLKIRNKSVNNPSVNLTTLHGEYLDLALKEQQVLVTNINEENGDGVCLTAIWLAMISLIQSSQQDTSGEYEVPIEWFVLQNSFSMCLHTARPLLSMDTATSMLVHAQPTIDNRNLDYKRYEIFQELVNWQPVKSPEIVDVQAQKAYEMSVAYLQTLYVRIAEGESSKLLGRRILAFANVPGSKFTSLLAERRPRALVILAHVLAMTKRLESVWWIFQGVADYHVEGLASMIPFEWQWAMEWPLRILSGQQPIIGFDV